jgi:DNA-binding response OmpR family regulator
MESKPKILIVDDRLENLFALEEILEEVDAEFIRALSGNEAVAETLRSNFALILMDVQMPDMDGFETVELIYKEKKNEHVPVIFISAIYSDEYYKIKGIRAGGIDFITKPVNDEILLGKVRIFLKLHHQKVIIEKTNIELREALSEVKTLSGLLPICSSCKKIRDDKGYWSQIESYIKKHSMAEFTHSICPECAKKLYPELFEDESL